jgi:hypothetical protein
MVNYVKSMVKNFPEKISKSNYFWNRNVFKVDNKSNVLSKTKKEIFHTFVAKSLFLYKRGSSDIQPAIAFLSTRVRESTEEDWHKLVNYQILYNNTYKDVIKISMGNTNSIKWYVDAAFVVHNDIKSHTGATMT